MRRSAAPSVCSRPFKKRKFCTPFSTNEKASSSPTIGVQKLSDQEPRPNNEEQKAEGKSSKDATEFSPSLVNKENRFLAKKAFKNPKDYHSSLKSSFQESKSDKPAARCDDNLTSKYFNVVWCKASKKKHKKWDGDGILVVSGRQVVLKDEEGKDIGKTSSYKSSELAALKEGETLFVGGKEIEVMSILSVEEYTSGRCFNQGVSQPTPAPSVSDKTRSVNSPNMSTVFSMPKKKLIGDDKNHLSSSLKRKQVVDKPRHNPNAPGAIVMPRPSASHQWLHNKQGLPVTDVVIDPFIASHLRSHQVEGVIFMYRCIMGMGNFNGNGAILADEMGLGKTLQCIALIWTLLKQGPYGGKSKFKRILIVTPGSLVKNWRAEFQKWLGNERLKTFAVGSDKTVEEFSRCIVYPVMIVSYEMLLRNLDDVKKIGFNLIVCDEGHRLKNFSIKTSAAISGLGISCMVLLTGTPIQNDLKEFYSLGDLCNPGIFGTASSFRRNFEAPIIRSQEPSCSAEEKSLGADRAAELKRLTDLFVLRRTSELNQAYLPPKAEFVVFCPLSTLQRTLYDKILNSRAVSMCISASDRGSGHLVCISALKKLCNHPLLLFPAVQEIENLRLHNIEDDQMLLYDGLLQLYPNDFEEISPTENCGKLVVLEKLIDEFKQTREKCVVVSNSTKTLDILESVLRTKDLRFLRLDGKTVTSDRQRLVDQFNSNSSGIDVFLLSSKAGGTGLNLVGASRLILYDIDWNPANDIQAMARVWRDGQKRKVHIYRLLCAGTIEEKMYQRQISKQGLSGHIVDLKTNKVEFSTEDLKDLFKLDEPDLCSTHDLLGCRCHETGEQELTLPESHARLDLLGKQHSNTKDKKILSMAELMSWNHILPTNSEKLVDDALKRCLEHVKFVFQNQSNTSST